MKKLFSLVKQANIKNYFANLVSGPEVNELIQTNHNMLGLGAPTQYDDQGYNKIDFSSNIVNRMANIAPGSEMAVQDGFDLLKVMAKYQGRQISNFKDLYLNFKRVADSAAQKDNYSHDFMKPKILGSIGNFFTIQLPQLKNIDDVKNSLFEKVSKLDSNVKNLLGLNNIFKHDSRFGPNSFIVKKNYLNQLLESLQENGYNTTGISPIEESPESDLSYEKKAILQTRNSFGNIGVRLVGSLGKELKGYDEQYKQLSAKVISDVAKFWHGDPAKTWQILSFTQADNFQHVWINKSVIGPVMESLSKHGFKVEDKLGVQKELEENKKVDEQVKSEKDLASEIPEEQLKISKKVLFSIGTQSLIELKLDETVINALIQKNRTNLDKVTKLAEMKQNIRDEIYETAIKVLFPINSAVADKSKGQLTSEDKIQKKVTDTKAFDKTIATANKKIADLQAKKVQISNKLKSFEQAIKNITNQTAAAAIRKSIQLELKNMSKIQNDIKKYKQQIQQSEQNVKNLQALPTRNQNGSRRTGSISYRFSLTGTIDSFSSLRQILAAEKYEGSDALANLIKQLQASGRMEQSDSIINGVPDGFLVKNDEGKTVFDKQKFEQALTSIDAKFKKTEIIDGKEVTVGGLLPLQKDGIKFLYSTKSAINSDQVGTGKTVQLIAAALLRQKQLGGKVVFFTLASVQPQFKRQVSRFTEIPVDEISDDPQSLKAWNVFRYDQISKGRNALINTRLLSSLSDLTVLALDEVHALKSPDAKATQSMNLITKKAKFVWGASATAAANTPMDLYSQLRIIKHPIGLMPFEMFEKEFDIPFHEAQDQAFRELVGTPEYEQADANTRKELEKNKALQKQILKTIKLKHIMSQAKIMIARSKKQAREDMPDLNIVKHDVKFEQSNEELSMIAADKMLEKLVNLNLIDLKDPQRNQQLQSDFVKLAYADKKKAVRLVQEVQKTSRIALAKQKFMYAPALQKIREVVALKKIPTTISRALEISNNTIKNEKGEEKHRKVLIFTAFTQAADEINKRLNSSYKNRRTGGFYQVSKIITGDNAKMRQEIVEDFKNHESETVFLVMTLKAGGTGIDFPNVTSDVIENDFEWTPSTSQQSRGRAYRINSKQNVRIHSILADGPDKGIREKVDLKIAIAEVINKNTYDIIRELEEGKQLNDSGVNIRMKTLVENTAKLMAIQSQAKKSQVSLYEGSESHNQAEQDVNDDISGADNSAYSVAKDAMKNTVQIFKEKIEMTGFKDTFRQVEEILGLNKKSAMSYYNRLIKIALNKSSTFKIAQEDVGQKINPEEVIQNSPKSLQKFQKKKKK